MEVHGLGKLRHNSAISSGAFLCHCWHLFIIISHCAILNATLTHVNKLAWGLQVKSDIFNAVVCTFVRPC